MTAHWFCPDRLFDGRLREGLAFRLEAGRVAELRARADLPPRAECRAIAGTVTPGYLDLQVNGGGNVLVNTTPTPDGMAAIAAAHRRLGTTGILPTVITDRPEVLARVVEAALAAQGRPGILGLHIEGPHLNVARRGTHAAELIRPLDAGTIAHLRRLRAAGVPVMLTLAPEILARGQIAELVAMGVVVSLGHTDATADETRAAFAEGAQTVTHLYNAMSPMLNRQPGVVGATINSTAYAGIICDGIHVADEMVGLAIRARPVPDRMFLVSDAMPTVGGADHFRLYGQDVQLVEGRLVNDEGSLAGAHVTMAESVARLVGVVGVSAETALRMAVTVPAELMGLPELGRFAGRQSADLICLDDAMRFVGPLDQVLAIS